VAVLVAPVRCDLIPVIALLAALDDPVPAVLAPAISVAAVAVPLVAIITLFPHVLFRESISAASLLAARCAACRVETWQAHRRRGRTHPVEWARLVIIDLGAGSSGVALFALVGAPVSAKLYEARRAAVIAGHGVPVVALLPGVDAPVAALLDQARD
jgi:hypothetical protein